MTQIRIRHEDEVTGAVLGDVPIGEVSTVLPTLEYAGLRIVGDARMTEFCTFSDGFVYDPESEESYFEIVVHFDEESR